MEKLPIIKSPTKPGPGYVEVTPELIQQLVDSKRRIVELRKKFEQFKEEMIAENLKNLENNHESI